MKGAWHYPKSVNGVDEMEAEAIKGKGGQSQ